MKFHSLLFLVTIVVTCRAYFLPAKRRLEGFRVYPKRGVHDRRTDSLDVEAQFSAESEEGGTDNFKDYNLQPSAVGFVSGDGGALVQAEAHSSSGNQYGEELQYSAGNSINEYGVDAPSETIYENHYAPSSSSEVLMEQTDHELGIIQADDTAQSSAEVQFVDTSQYSVEAQADKIIKSNIEFTAGAKLNPESQVDSSVQDNSGAQKGEGSQVKYSTVPPRPNTSNGVNQYSAITPINPPTASQSVLPWHNEKSQYGGNIPISTLPYSKNPYNAPPPYVAGNPYNSYAGSYNGGSYNAGSYNAGTYNAGSYNGGSFNGGSYNGASYNGVKTAVGYVGTNKIPPSYNAGPGYGLNQGSLPNQYTGNVYNTGPQTPLVNQGNSYSQYGTFGGYNNSKFSSSQYSTAEGIYSKPGSYYSGPISPPKYNYKIPANTATPFNTKPNQKITPNALSTQGRAPYSLYNYNNAEGFEAGMVKTKVPEANISTGGTSTNIIEKNVIQLQENADSKVYLNSVQSSKTDVGQPNQGSKYSGEIYSVTPQAQEEAKTLARAYYGGESQSSSEVKQNTGTQYPKLDKNTKGIKAVRPSSNVPLRKAKRNRSKKVQYSSETPYVPNTLHKLEAEAPQDADIPPVAAVETRFKHNYPHRDYGYEHQRSPRWQQG